MTLSSTLALTPSLTLTLTLTLTQVDKDMNKLKLKVDLRNLPANRRTSDERAFREDVKSKVTRHPRTS
jgi:hypothetical protein